MGKTSNLWKNHDDVNSKIIVSLERISRVFRILLTEEANKHDVSPLPMQILLYLRNNPAERSRVSRMEKEFGLSMPTGGRAVGTLIKKGLLEKHTSEADKRETILSLTRRGKTLSKRLSNWADRLRGEIEELPREGKPEVLKFLLDFIGKLDRKGIISATRTCITCKYFTITGPPSDPKFFCLLLDKPLSNSELRADCEDHVCI